MKTKFLKRVLWLMIPLLTMFSINAWGTSTNASFSHLDLIGQGAGSPGAAFVGASRGSITMGGVGNGAASYVQIYQNGTLTFTPLSGATIKSIVLTATNDSYARTWSASPTGVSVSSATITWSGSSTSTVTLTNTYNGQARITAMVVTYDIGTTYDVEWFVGGSSVSHDAATEPVVTALTGVEDDDLGGPCSSLTFMGWSETNIGSTPTNTRPTDFLGTTIINEDKDYYAVFADCSSESAWEITEIDNINGGTGYGAFDGSHTASGISYTSSDVMEQSSTIQFKAGAGYMYNTTAFASAITRIVITSNQMDWHVYTSSSQISAQPGSGEISRLTINSGEHTYWVSSANQTYFFIKGGAALSQSTSIKVYYGSISDYRTECIQTYTVTYDKGAQGSGTMTDSNSPYEAGDEVTVLESTFTEVGYPFTGWVVKDAGDNPITVTDGKFTMPSSNVTITAQWGVAYEDTFKDMQNGNSDKHRTGVYSQSTPTLSDITPGEGCGGQHYKFIGWVKSTYVNDDGSLKDGATIVPGGESGHAATGDTYYAIWGEDVTP